MNGPLPIQISEVMAFCALAGVRDPTERVSILHAVQAMDGAYLGFAYERMERERKAKAKRKPGRRR